MSESAKKSLVIFIYAALVLSTLLVFWQVRNFGFVNYDDNNYVYENPHVSGGLTRDGIIWAFSTSHTGYWHPLTWLSLMLDCRLFGADAGWMHFVNLLLHLANTLLLFAVLRKMTGSLWQSAFVAAVFALHPMHVESVAWIAERKDVLSTFFLLLTLAAYVSYVKRPSIFRYLIALTLFALGLMAKPMLVTLPLLLVLLDYWPLNRFDAQPAKISGRQSGKPATTHDGRAILQRLMIEKIPFLVLAAISCVITFLAQRSSGAVKDIELEYRLVNVLVSYVEYIGKMFWPRNLAAFYPYDAGAVDSWEVVLCALLMIAVSVLAIRFGRKQKYLLVGWLWFVVTLVPVIGLVQVGGQALADRYTYIPYIGLFIMIAWGLPELLSKWPQRRIALGLSMAVVLATLGICAHRQVSYWNDSIALFSHAIEVTKNNYLACNNRGLAYLALGRSAEAMDDFHRAIRIKLDYADAYTNLGTVYGGLGRSAEAIDAFRQAIKIKPDSVEARYNLARDLLAQGSLDEAVDQYREVLRLRPDWPALMNDLAWLIIANPHVRNRDTNEAIRLARGACELEGYKAPVMLGTLAAAYASAGRFAEAVDMAKRAIALADAANQPQIRDTIRHHLSLYTQGKPYTRPAPDPLPDSNKP